MIIRQTAKINKLSGFTLVELVTVMLITGIIAMMVVNMITTPMEAYSDMKRRAELVDIAEITLQRMARDIHHALPNSVRLQDFDGDGNNEHLEILHTIDGGRYVTNGSDAFTTTTASTSFGLLKKLNISSAQAVGSSVVVYNLGGGGADAYQTTPVENRSQITALTDTLISYNLIQFPFSSPQSRFMIVDQPITFGCSLAERKLYLRQGYAVSATMTQVSNADFLLADNITSCQFDYSPGSTTRPGLVTLEITISKNNEKITLLHQVFVENQP